MMLLQDGGASLVQLGTGGVLVLNTALLLKMAYSAGEWTQRLKNLEAQVARLQETECPYGECPIKAARVELDAHKGHTT